MGSPSSAEAGRSILRERGLADERCVSSSSAFPSSGHQGNMDCRDFSFCQMVKPNDELKGAVEYEALITCLG